MRIVLLWSLVLGSPIYAWRNSCVAICALILLNTVMQRRDSPTCLLGINGLNPWNLCLLATLCAGNAACC